jgi:hypothetical protein
MQLRFFILLISFSFLIAESVYGQEKRSAYRSPQTLTENDTLVFRILEQINVFPKKGKGINYKQYARTVVKIRKVYPFAKDAALEIVRYNQLFMNSKSEKERKKYVKKVEKELFAKYEGQLKHFTISEGRYLMLLIDRETTNTSYSIIKEVKGGLSATFWQSVAKLFKNDLKEEYDPIYNHYVIEQIVLMIEAEEKTKKASR